MSWRRRAKKQKQTKLVRELDETVHSLQSYSCNNAAELERALHSWTQVPRFMLEAAGFNPARDLAAQYHGCTVLNQKFLDLIASVASDYQQSDALVASLEKHPIDAVSHSHIISLLVQFAREWTAVLAEERNGCFGPMLDALLQHFPDRLTLPTQVLVPGSGLGRLMLEVAALGFHCQGCEYNYYNLLGANLMLNYCIPVNEIVFCPFMHGSLNQKTRDNRFRRYPLPDVCAAEMIKGAGSLNLVAGEFVQSYHAQNAEWDAVLTAFFIDTSRNVFLYVLVIAKITKPGGLWANYGPLLYHHSGSDNALNVDVSADVLLQYVQQFFDVKEHYFKPLTYTHDVNCMSATVYDCLCFAAVRNSTPAELRIEEHRDWIELVNH